MWIFARRFCRESWRILRAWSGRWCRRFTTPTRVFGRPATGASAAMRRLWKQTSRRLLRRTASKQSGRRRVSRFTRRRRCREPSFLRRRRADPRLRLPASIICIGILRCCSLNPIQGEFYMTEVPQQGEKAPSEGLLEAPRFEDGKQVLVAGLRSHYTMATMAEIPGLWQRFVAYFGKVPGQVGRVAYGVCFPLADGFDYMAGVEVESSKGLPEELNMVTMPAERYAVFPHRGHISKLQETCRAIEHEWLPK